MPGILRCQGSTLILLLGMWAAVSGCEPFDNTRREIPRGTLGEELYKVACERLVSEQMPEDVSGAQARALCHPNASASTAPAGRIRALIENRTRLVEALDRTLPASLEDELQNLLVAMLPFYDAPSELLPSNTRAIGKLLGDLMAEDDVLAALGRMSQRRGMRQPLNALGLVRPILTYPGLPDLTTAMLARIDDGGALEPEWKAVLEAAALEMATAEPSAPDDETLSIVRDLVLRRNAVFGSETPHDLYVVERDSRGLPVPAFLDGSQGFVDLDTDGLADADELGRFLAADGSLLNPATPFPVIDESGVSRDEHGRALATTNDPLYVFHEVDQSLLAGLLREGPQLLDPADPIAIELAKGLLPLLGPSLARSETFGAHDLAYDGFDTANGPIFDLAQAGAELLTHTQTPDVLALAQILLANHEDDLAPLIESGFFGDALGDQHPEADLVANSELWDDLIQTVVWIAQVQPPPGAPAGTPNMLEAVLRSFNDPRGKRLGQILAEMMRFRDVPTLNAANPNQRLEAQYFSNPVDRTQPDNGPNQSLFQQTIAVIHELNGAEFCNKQDANMFAFGININWVVGGPFDRCEVMRLANTTEAFIQAILGRAHIDVNIGFLGDLLGYLAPLGLGLDDIMEDESGIEGLTQSPTPYAMARLVYGPWNKWLTELLERPHTFDYNPAVPNTEEPNRVMNRFPGRPILAWERVYRFCGDRLLDQGETCPTPIESVSFYQAMAPLLEVFDDYDPRIDHDSNPATPPRYLFGELIGALHKHYPTAANTSYQPSPTAARFAAPDRAVTYEPIIAELIADCAWQPTGASSRNCVIGDTGRLLTRLTRLTKILDNIEVRPGVDGIDVLAASTARLVLPSMNTGLRNRAGATTTQTNAGSRTVQYTPLYLLLDALNAMDDAHDTDPEGTASWYAARSRLIDIFLATEPLANDRFRLANRRVHAISQIALGFTDEQIAKHRAAGDLTTWARALDDDLEEVLGGALASRLVRFLDALNEYPETQRTFLELTQYLLDEASHNDAFENLLLTAADALFLLEDDETLVVLMRSVADALAVGAKAAVEGTGTISVEGSIADEGVSLLNKSNEVDTARTMTALLANAVTHPPGELETPIEVILDVVAEVNRATPNAGGPLAPNDHGAVMRQVFEFLGDEDRGLERVYDVVQSRESVQ